MRPVRTLLPLLLGSLILATACNDQGTDPQPPDSIPTALRLSPRTAFLRLGESTPLEVELLDSGGRAVAASSPLSWSSSAPHVVSVDAMGMVTALAVGSATVTARAGALADSTEVTVRAPEPVAGSNSPVSATVDSAGGSIDAMGADGTRYTLAVPRHALREPTVITMTPLASVEHFPTEAGASAAVLFEPHGLVMAVPAELTIVAPGPFAAGSAGFSQSSEAFVLEPARIRGDTARLLVGHFSSAGTTAPTAEEVAALTPGSASAEATARHGVTEELSRASLAGEQPDQDVVAGHLKNWFENGVIPGLEAAAAGQREVEEAVAEWIRWLTNLQTWADGHLEPEAARGHAAAAVALRAGIDRLNQRCRDANDVAYVGEILHLAALAALLGADDVDPSLGLDEVFADLCVRVAIEASLPEPFVQGSTLTVRAGLAIGDHPADYETPLDITLTSATANLSRASGMTSSGGEFTSEVDLREGHAEVVVDVEAVHPTTPRLRASHRVTARARYKLELDVGGGKETEIETEDVAWLSVALQKAEAPLSGAAVSLSVLGGGSVEPAAIVTDDAGLGASVYTAPEVGDTVRVVAAFSEGGELVTDTVTIAVIEVPTGRVRIDDVYQAFGASAHATQNGFPPSTEEHNDWISIPGQLAGGYAASASSGGASSSGSTTHESSVEQYDADTLLVVQAKATALGSASASRAADAGATLSVGSDAHVIFEVLDAPVYYEIEASGVTGGGGGSAVELSVLGSGQKLLEKYWHAAPDSIGDQGWLPPGLYSFDAAGSVSIGAGSNNPDGDSSASGSLSYEVVFRLLEREPKEEEDEDS